MNNPNTQQSVSPLVKHLQSFDDAFAEARPAGGKVPDGEYAVTVEQAEFKTSKAGNPMLSWTFEITSGPCKGLRLWSHSMLQTEANVRFLKRDLEACGLALARLSELPGRLSELLGLRLVVEKRTNGDFENVHVKSRLRAETKGNASQAERHPAQEVDFGEVPF